MTMKSLLLGAAAGLLTVGAAQAADLPMTKAEPVEYVKVCSEFGEGFFYIPGTDTCLKISGEVRANYRFQDRDNRETNVTGFNVEPRLKFDARTATEYGTLRSYIQVNMPIGGLNDIGNQNSGATWNLDKAFIQFGGLTAGFAHTFFGIYDADYGNTIFAPYYSSQSTVNLLAYTAVFGGGFSATLSVEDGRDHRSNSGVGLGGVTFVSAPIIPGNSAVFDFTNEVYGGQSMPDFVANLRIDGGWGEAAVFGAVHQIRYPGEEALFGTPAGVYVPQDATYGWAVGAGVGWNFPWFGLTGSHIALEATYADGANNYLGFNSSDSIFALDAPYNTTNGKGWSITGEWGVNWTPALNVTAFGSYLHYSGYSETIHDPAAPLTDVTSYYGFDTGSFNNWVAGINATYTVVPGLVIQPEVYYQRQEVVNFNDPSAPIDSENSWNGGVRIKRTF
jgi:hypothetical protein